MSDFDSSTSSDSTCREREERGVSSACVVVVRVGRRGSLIRLSSDSTCSTVCERRKFQRHCGIERDALKRSTDLRPVRSSPVI